MPLLTISNKQEISKFYNLIGNTPVYTIKKDIPNNNKIFIKAEYKNPTGSHYDRVYLEIFKDLEKKRVIQRGKTSLIEITSGNAGVSFAMFCKLLNYKSYVIVPKFMNITEAYNLAINGTRLLKAKYNDYILGANRTLKEFLLNNRQKLKTGDLFCLNHSNKEVALLGTKKIGTEIIDFCQRENIIPDFFIPACGNGTSIIGPSDILKHTYPDIKIYTFESKSAPVGYKQKYPEKYEKQFGKDYKNKKHHLFGTSAYGVYFPFIMDNKFSFNTLVDDVFLLDDFEWLKEENELMQMGFNVGHTSIAAYYMAKRVAQHVQNKNIFIIFYDKRSKFF